MIINIYCGILKTVVWEWWFDLCVYNGNAGYGFVEFETEREMRRAYKVLYLVLR